MPPSPNPARNKVYLCTLVCMLVSDLWKECCVGMGGLCCCDVHDMQTPSGVENDPNVTS